MTDMPTDIRVMLIVFMSIATIVMGFILYGVIRTIKREKQ